MLTVKLTWECRCDYCGLVMATAEDGDAVLAVAHEQGTYRLVGVAGWKWCCWGCHANVMAKRKDAAK